MNKLAFSWIYSKFIMKNIPFMYVYLWYIYFLNLLSVYVSYDIQYNMIHDMKKKKKRFTIRSTFWQHD